MSATTTPITTDADEARDVERQDRAPDRAPLEDDLARRDAGPSRAETIVGRGAIGSPGRAAHDGPRAARAVRLPAARGRRRGLGARRPLRPPRRRRRGHRAGRRLRARPRRAAARARGARCPPSSSTSRCGWRAEYCSTPARALSLLLPPKGTRAKTALWARPSGATGRGRAPDRPPARAARLAAALRRRRPRRAAAPGGARARAHRAARRAPRAAARRPSAPRAAQPELTADQAAALRAIATRAARRAAAAARRHRLGQDRGLPAGRGGGARRRAAA